MITQKEKEEANRPRRAKRKHQKKTQEKEEEEEGEEEEEERNEQTTQPTLIPLYITPRFISMTSDDHALGFVSHDRRAPFMRTYYILDYSSC